MNMITVSEAHERLRSNNRVRVDDESVDLKECLGRVLAADVVSSIDVPPADNSAMDGYALRREDWPGADHALEISQRITAGTSPAPLKPGTAARIFTGAETPEGADVVVMQEKCKADANQVTMNAVGNIGANIRPRGQDIRQGGTVLQQGHRLRAQDLGLIASLGIARIDARCRLKVAIISTGEELVEPGKPLKPGQIYNSNRYMLQALLEAWGFDVLDFGITADDPQIISGSLSEASREADAIITTGGVSVGEEDHVKAVVESLGHIDLWRVAIKPGKPFAFGDVLGTPFLGLPGNPVSAFVTALVIARPYLFDCQGVNHSEIVPLRETALFDKKGSFRQEYLRVRSTAGGVEMFEKQSSGVLYSTSWGDGFVVQKPDEDIRKGERVDVIPFVLFN
ncbi:MAG: molybdopterin molybdotransferase MoeA [Xanthomonadales bacterium]|nr:molybdopterin molybdotransferase MoeA [Xanthomonadales bacterium]